MDKNIIGAFVAVPLLLFSSNFGSGPSCNFTKPALVYERACQTDGCRAEVRKHLPSCEQKLAANLSAKIRYDGGVATAPYLSLASMDKLTDCIASAELGTFDRTAVDLSRFSEVRKDVRAAEFKNVAGGCKEGNCSGVYMRPVVGQTTFLYGPA